MPQGADAGLWHASQRTGDLRAGPPPLIAPMTVLNSQYFAETVGRLRERGHDVRHLALLVKPETVLRRLRHRGGGRAIELAAGRARAAPHAAANSAGTLIAPLHQQGARPMIGTASKNAVPLPLRELGDEPSIRRERRQGDRHLRALHPWCNVIEDPTHGEATSVAIHGPWSVGRGRVPSGGPLDSAGAEDHRPLGVLLANAGELQLRTNLVRRAASRRCRRGSARARTWC